MASPFLLFSSSLISCDELADFVVAHGGFTTSDVALNNRFSQQRKHAWFSVNSIHEGQDWRGDQNDLMHGKLGKPPQVYVTIEISDEPESEVLALETAISVQGGA